MQEQLGQVFEAAIQGGVTFFDTAEVHYHTSGRLPTLELAIQQVETACHLQRHIDVPQCVACMR